MNNLFGKKKKRDVLFDAKTLRNFENMRVFEGEFMRGLIRGPDMRTSFTIGCSGNGNADGSQLRVR